MDVLSADNPRVVEAVRSAIDARNCILMAGAGLSAQAETESREHPPGWEGLLQKMVAWCEKWEYVDDSYAAELRTLIKAGFLIDAGQEIEELLVRRSKSVLQQCLRQTLLCDDLKLSDAHKLVMSVPFRAFLTTNYDTLLEDAYTHVAGRSLPKYYETSLDSVMQAFREGQPFILKLHGDIQSESPIVLGDRSYQRLRHSDHYARCLNNLFSTCSVLFVGFGGSDPDLDGLLSEVAEFDGRRHRHWMLAPASKFPRLKARRLQADRGISVIEYHVDESHSGLVRFLREIAAPNPGGSQRSGKPMVRV